VIRTVIGLGLAIATASYPACARSQDTLTSAVELRVAPHASMGASFASASVRFGVKVPSSLRAWVSVGYTDLSFFCLPDLGAGPDAPPDSCVSRGYAIAVGTEIPVHSVGRHDQGQVYVMFSGGAIALESPEATFQSRVGVRWKWGPVEPQFETGYDFHPVVRGSLGVGFGVAVPIT